MHGRGAAFITAPCRNRCKTSSPPSLTAFPKAKSVSTAQNPPYGSGQSPTFLDHDGCINLRVRDNFGVLKLPSLRPAGPFALAAFSCTFVPGSPVFCIRYSLFIYLPHAPVGLTSIQGSASPSIFLLPRSLPRSIWSLPTLFFSSIRSSFAAVPSSARLEHSIRYNTQDL